MIHLLLPLAASILFVCGLIFIKRTSEHDIRPISVMFLTNFASAISFSFLWALGGDDIQYNLLWQPTIVAGLFMTGLILTFTAVDKGDVSIATPIFGTKVIFVAILLAFLVGESLPLAVWMAAMLATLGIGMIQWTGRQEPKRVLTTIAFALGAATSYALYDCLVQRWTPKWGTGRFLPIVFWIVGIMSLTMIPWVQWSKIKTAPVAKLIIPGATLVALQAICITCAIGIFGDAARVNVVYSLRGLWGVGLAWIAALIWGGAEAHMSRAVMQMRLAGASLLTAAVVLAILAR